MNSIYFIINPQAKNGYCQKVWRKLESILLEQQVSYLAFFTEYKGHAKEIVQTIGSKTEGKKVVIVAVGGDGTMHEVMNGAVSFPHIHIAFIPGGSGNDFSRGFHIPRKPTKALMELLHSDEDHTTLVDIGKITNEEKKELYFINNIGAGFDALIAKEVNKSKMKRIFNRLSLGKFVYVYFLLKNLFFYKPTNITLKVDGVDRTYRSAWFVAVSNQPFYGGGMKISPHASPVDGILNITIVHQLSKIKLLFVFITVFWGGHTRFKEVASFTGRSVHISSNRPLCVHADGEDIGTTPVTITAYQKHLPVLLNNIMNEEEGKTNESY
ncbi:diacylglycerol kinase family lipid kinase [Cytobacillus depressus]|uniref:Diacylglycerol kinase family lipid kinase n=1 Tax=Cytobacillus depressus TaxID=1602942 RepID=A0A6L3VB38_9BACI|nr:diacylglycerol kinase family protein [Cytobacillus depressus]KAB2338881.1 diacylglycerol kinase family lipid kinase [Cytobacillus depressus]